MTSIALSCLCFKANKTCFQIVKLQLFHLVTIMKIVGRSVDQIISNCISLNFFVYHFLKDWLKHEHNIFLIYVAISCTISYLITLGWFSKATCFQLCSQIKETREYDKLTNNIVFGNNCPLYLPNISCFLIPFYFLPVSFPILCHFVQYRISILTLA